MKLVYLLWLPVALDASTRWMLTPIYFIVNMNNNGGTVACRKEEQMGAHQQRNGIEARETENKNFRKTIK